MNLRAFFPEEENPGSGFSEDDRHLAETMLLGNAEMRKRTLISENGLELGLGSSESTVNTVHSNTQKPIKTESRVEDTLYSPRRLCTPAAAVRRRRGHGPRHVRPWPRSWPRCVGDILVSWWSPGGLLVVSWWSRWWSRGCDTGDHLRGTYVRLGRARTSFGLTRLP